MISSALAQAIIVCGVPASGKTAFGKELSRRLGWAYLDLDTVTNPLFEYAGGEFLVDVPSADPPIRATVNDVRYRCLYDTARENLEVDMSVVVVAPFTSERTFPSAWASVAQRLAIESGRVHLVWIDTPANEVVRRMINRGAPRDIEKIANPDLYLTPDVMRAPGVPHWRVDGMPSPSTQVSAFTEGFVSCLRNEAELSQFVS